MKLGETLYLVIPCYNEQEVLAETAARLTEKLHAFIQEGKISALSRIVFVDDGSKDRTWALIEELHAANPLVDGIRMSRNRGHQNTLYGGLMTVKERCDFAISMDADLQDDIRVLDQFIEKYCEGYEIVYGVRSSRKKDSFFKRATAQTFYRIMKLFGVEIIYNHADYRLMSRRAMDELGKFKEVNLFLRGVVPLIGLRSCTVKYERQKRFAGKSKYPLGKMLAFATDGITSFSIKPIRLITSLGLLIFAVSVIMLIYFLAVYFLGKTVSGWASTVISIWAIGGLQMMAIGVIGEYIGKIYMEAKGRPKYIVEEYLRRKRPDAPDEGETPPPPCP